MKYYGKKLWLLLAASLLILAAVQAAQARPSRQQAPNPKVIGISFPGGTKQAAVLHEFAAAQAEAKKLGYKLLINDPGTDTPKQVAVVETWIEQGVGTIIGQPLEPATMETVAKKARSAGIKWVTYANVMKNQDATLGFDHVYGGGLIGKAAGDWITKNLGGKAKVAILTFVKGSWARKRQAGIEAALKKAAPGAQIVARQDALSETDGLSATSSILQAHSDLNVVLAVEETASEGAYQAFLNAGHKPNDPKVFLAGIDGTLRALHLLYQGNTMYRASAGLSLTGVGLGMVRLPARLWAGKKGDYIVPFQLLTPTKKALTAKYLADWGVKAK